MNNKPLFEAVRQAGRELGTIPARKINDMLLRLADAMEQESVSILEANQKDLDRMDPSNPKYDRLKLTTERISGIASDMRNVASLPSPLGRSLTSVIRPNGLHIEKISVPLGVIGVIYEARPNVTFDVFSLCIKAGNACLLKGGSDAEYSNRCIMELIHRVLSEQGFNPNVTALLPTDREATAELLQARGYVDIIIPRGSQQLIQFVCENSRIPVIETGAGVVHTYFDKDGDLAKGRSVILNAKTRRVSVCNALECLLVHRDRLSDLPALVGDMAARNVVLFADASAFEALKGQYPEPLLQPATEASYGMEFLDYKMAIRTVNGPEEAMEHIYRYSTRHSEAILTENPETARQFTSGVDAAAVYVNVSTAFTDGAQFGLGADIGISTQKLHARGPMGLEELTSYKWIITGNGQTRP